MHIHLLKKLFNNNKITHKLTKSKICHYLYTLHTYICSFIKNVSHYAKNKTKIKKGKQNTCSIELKLNKCGATKHIKTITIRK
jgi:hypothetical protein